MHVEPRFGSGQTDGNPVAIAATSTPGTALHTAVAGTEHLDEIFAYVTNTTAADIVVTFELDGTATANQVKQTIPAGDGWHQVLNGVRMNNAGTVAAFAGAVGCNMRADVNRIYKFEA